MVDPFTTAIEAACPEMKMIPGRAPAWTKTTPYTTMPNSTKALLMPEGEAPIVVVTAVAVRTEGDPTPVPVPEMCKMVVNTRRTEASFTTTCLQTRRLPHPRPQAVLLPRHKGDRMASTFQTESTVGQLSSSTKSPTITASLTVGNSKSTEVADSGCGLMPFSGESSIHFDHRTKRV